MSTRKDQEFAMNGEPASVKATEQEISDIAMQDRVETDSEFVIFKLVDTSRNGRVYIDGIADIPNPDNGGKIERARLLAGVNTIWQSQQKDIDPSYVRMNRQSLEFVGKVCRIFKWEETKLQFARLNPNNIGSPSKKTGSRLEYFEYNPKKQQEEALKRQMAKINLVMEVSKLNEEASKKLAVFLGIRLIDDLAQPKTPDGIKTELMVMADSDPIRVQKYMGSKEVDISYLVRKMIVENKIEIGGHSGDAVWANGGVICKIPTNRQPHEYLTELAMTNSKDGKQFLEQLQTKA